MQLQAIFFNLKVTSHPKKHLHCTSHFSDFRAPERNLSEVSPESRGNKGRRVPGGSRNQPGRQKGVDRTGEQPK